MKAIKRRTFIKSFLSSTILLGIISKSTNSHSGANLSYIYPNKNDELIKAYNAWINKYKQTPNEYLNSINLIKPREVACKCRNDFKTGNTLEIEGLILSKTEIAFILKTYFG